MRGALVGELMLHDLDLLFWWQDRGAVGLLDVLAPSLAVKAQF